MENKINVKEMISKKYAKKLARKNEIKQKKIKDKLMGTWISKKKLNSKENNVLEGTIISKDIDNIVIHISFIENMRIIEPYIYTFKLYAKSRWFGLSLLDIFITEFTGFTKEYYIEAIKNGFILVNKNISSMEYKIKDGDFIEHKLHRHEPPIWLNPKSKLIELETEDLLVINKPSTLPVHPCGSYHYNSLTHLLAKEYNYVQLFTVHRIDRLTSGLVLLAKSSEKANLIASEITNHTIHKTYIAMVLGKFPSSNDDPSLFKNTVGCINSLEKDNEMYWKYSAPILCICRKRNIRICHENGKDSETYFKFIRYDHITNKSIIKCYPVTGRTHQIRVHLQSLGFPIANDPIYGDLKILDIKTFEADPLLKKDPSKENFKNKLDNASINNDLKTNKNIENHCFICQNGTESFFSSIQLQCKGIYLHAYKYQTDDWSYEVSLPEWY